MEWADIMRRIDAGEDERTEFKRELGNLSAVGRAMCAFANGDGGVIILGVDDSGATTGIDEDPSLVQERLTSFLQTGCSGPVSARCGRYQEESGWVHWIDVPRVRDFEPLHYDKRYYVRLARSSVEAAPREREKLFNAFGFVLTEQQMITAASIDDIDVHAFRSFQAEQGLVLDEEPQPPFDRDLRNARVLHERDGMQHPTLYGLMVFGKAPQTHPQTGSFWIQCAAYEGEDRASPVILAGDAKGRLDEQVNRALGWMASLGRTETYAGIFREDGPLIPDNVLREALVNAVVHRDYAIVGANVLFEVFRDRVVITSPATLPNHMAVEEILYGSLPRSRNEWMANAMVVRSLMERRGLGWPMMRREMRKFNRTEPELVHDRDGKYVRVTFRMKRSFEDCEE